MNIYNPEKDAIIKSRPYPGVYNAGPAVDGDAFLKDLLDGMATWNDGVLGLFCAHCLG